MSNAQKSKVDPGAAPITESPRFPLIHSLFEEQAAARPDAVAVHFGEEELTWSRLNKRANCLAHRLQQLGIRRGALVGLCIERSPELIVALLGILIAGAAYVPLDPDHPDERLDFLLQDTKASVVVVHPPTRSRMHQVLDRAGALCVDVVDCRSDQADNQVKGEPDDLAYVMYTSGSTGRPKGVLVVHRAVVRLVRNTNYCHFGPDEVFLQVAPLSFDASTFEIWGPLLNGGRLALMPPGVPALDALGTAIRRYQVTTLWLTAGLFHLMVEQRAEDLEPLRQLVAGGSVLSPTHVQRALAAMRDGVLINGYGPTESTTFACCYRMSKDYQVGQSIPIGQPISNTTAYILDEEFRPVGVGVPGELCVGGDGLARGYLNNPELTAEKFIPDAFSGKSGARLYRTGDRVRQCPDGNFEFLGRFDDQVKILGYRIEPGEIESVLRQHPEVSQSVVVTAASRGEKQLVAYVVTSGTGGVASDELQRYLQARLPAYMLPGHIVRMDSLPLNRNGKVDRSALPAPDRHRAQSSAPATDLETRIVALWNQLLQCPVGTDDNFFDLGGSSLLLLEMHEELKKRFRCELSTTELFVYTTVRSLARRLAVAAPDSGPGFARVTDRARRQKEAFARQRLLRGTNE